MTSITLDGDVKREHEELKPASLTWNEYLHIVAQSIDAERFRALLEAHLQRELDDAVERARERYEKALSDPDRLLSADAARQRVREQRKTA